MRKIDEIVIHCTATNSNWYENRPVEDAVNEIRRWHTDPKPQGRGWSDIGYHAVIHRNGDVGMGRPTWRAGAHVAGKNKTTLGIALMGGRGGCADDAFEDNYTPEQNAALRDLIAQWKAEFKIKKVSAHNDYAKKACPCFDVKKWVAKKA